MGYFVKTDIKKVEINHDLKIYVYVRDNDGPSEYILKNKIYERVVTHYFNNYLKKGYIVFDIGANIGWFSLIASRRIGDKGKVFSFEPEPLNYEVLIKNIDLNGLKNIIPIRKAVSNFIGEVDLNISSINKGAHTLLPTNDKYRSFKVETITIDSFINENNVSPNVIKMDIEGAEPLALAGMNNLLSKTDELIIFSEFNPYFFRKGGGDPEQYINTFIENKFKIFDINQNNDKLHLISSAKEALNLCVNRSYLNIMCIKENISSQID